MDKKQKNIIIFIACLAVLLAGCIVAAVVLFGNAPGALSEPATTEQTLPTEEMEEATESDAVTDTTGATEPTADTIAPSQPAGSTGNQGSAGNQGNTGNQGSGSKPTEPEEEDETPTVGVDDATTPLEEENDIVIEFDDLLEKANGKKNED